MALRNSASPARFGARVRRWPLFLAAMIAAIPLFWLWVAMVPLPLDWARGSLENRLQVREGYHIHFDRAFLTWSREDFAPAIHVRELQFADGSHAFSLEIPKASFILGWKSLARFSLAPTALFLEDMSLSFSLDLDPSRPPDMARLSEILPRLSERYHQWRAWVPLTNITSVGLRHSSLSLKAGENVWNLGIREWNVLQQGDSRSTFADISLLSPSCADPGPALNRWTIDYRHDGKEGTAAFDIRFSPIRADRLAGCAGEYARWLGGLALPISGTLGGTIDSDSRLGPVTLDITAGAGTIDLPGLKPSPLDRANLQLRLRDRHIDILSLSAAAGQSALHASGTAALEAGNYLLSAQGQLRDTPMAMIKDLWPEALAVPTRDWVMRSIDGGEVTQARMNLLLALPDDDLFHPQLRTLEGDIDIRGMSAEYLEGMPPVRHIEAGIVFSKQRFDISILAADIGGLKLTEGWVYLYDLDTDIERARIIVPIREAPARAVMEILNHPPLRARERMDIPQPIRRGMISGQSEFVFPLRKDLRIEDVRLKTKARITNLEIRRFLLDQDLSRADLDLDLDSSGMVLQGRAAIASVSADVRAYYDFRDEGSGRTYQARFVLPDRALGRAGMHTYLTGEPSVELTLGSSKDGAEKLALRIDLTDCAFQLPMIDWRKPAMIPAMAELSLNLEDDPGPIGIDRFHFSSPSARGRGRGTLNHDGTPREITFDDAWIDGLGHGRMTIDWRDPQRIEADLDAQSVDLSTRLSLTPTAAAREPGDPKGRPETKGRDVALSFRIDALRLPQGDPLTNAQGRIYQRRGRLQHLEGTAAIDPQHSARWSLYRQGNASLAITVDSDDGGEILRRLDLFDQIDGGEMSLKADITKGIMRGTLNLKDYGMRESPLLLQFLSLPSLTGLLDRLTEGQDMVFDRMGAPFTFDGDTLSFDRANMWNSSLGITFSGTIATDDDALDLAGEVVPAYTLNSILGNIPVLGTLLTDNRQRNILAANYTLQGTLAEPKITLNPLSTLTPGIFRRIFDIFQSAADPPETDEKGPKRTPF